MLLLVCALAPRLLEEHCRPEMRETHFGHEARGPRARASRSAGGIRVSAAITPVWGGAGARASKARPVSVSSIVTRRASTVDRRRRINLRWRSRSTMGEAELWSVYVRAASSLSELAVPPSRRAPNTKSSAELTPTVSRARLAARRRAPTSRRTASSASRTLASAASRCRAPGPRAAVPDESSEALLDARPVGRGGRP